MGCGRWSTTFPADRSFALNLTADPVLCPAKSSTCALTETNTSQSLTVHLTISLDTLMSLQGSGRVVATSCATCELPKAVDVRSEFHIGPSMLTNCWCDLQDTHPPLLAAFLLPSSEHCVLVKCKLALQECPFFRYSADSHQRFA